ncbi:MAG: RHS repeat-associated core domain-containing protein, partial [Verrucomicrobia bacterium]|nr:RHS repeat-associated core domain-containing protein [Verrucomicrobiota bacterium]
MWCKEDARWLYTRDGENRLTAMEEKQTANSSLGQTPPARQRLEFAYDSQSRRVRKVVKVLQGQTWSVTSDLRFVYDAWNLLAELTMKPGTSNLELLRSYAWGYDLSGSEQGAGGVGGLVLVKQLSTTVNNGQPSSTVSAPCYDGNGNILAYLDCASGTVTQRMEYDAFGNEMTLDSVLAGNTTFSREVPFRFSTKYADSETGLSYYGYRYYSEEMGWWTARDPVEDFGGTNIQVMLTNNIV